MQPRLDRLFGSSATKARITLSLVVALTLSLILALMLPAPVKAEENPEGPAAVAAEPSESPTKEPAATPTAAESDAETDPATNGENDESAGEEEADETIAGDEGDEEAAESDVKPTFRSRSANLYRRGAIGGGSGLGNCVAGNVYSLSKSGKMSILQPDGKTWTALPEGSIQSYSFDPDFNGLGVYNDKQGNSTWYAYERGIVKTSSHVDYDTGIETNRRYKATVQPYRNVNGRGWEPFGNSYMFGDEMPEEIATYWIDPSDNPGYLFPAATVLGGAVNPKDGSYWVLQYLPKGGFYPEGKMSRDEQYDLFKPTTSTQVRLIRIDPRTGAAQDWGSQTVPVFDGRAGKKALGLPNGDMAFDSEGNAYLVHTITNYPNDVQYNTHGATKIYTVDAKYLNNGQPGFKMDVPSKARWPQGLGQNTGVAFDFPAGQLIVASTKGSKAFTVPELGGVAGSEVSGLDMSFDLASCSFPHTLELRKNVVDRVDDADQFLLTITSSDGEVQAEKTTTGSKKGVQDETAGPILVSQGAKFTITEQLVPGSGSKSKLKDYDSTVSCIETSYAGLPEYGPVKVPVTAATLVGDNIATAEVTIPNVPRQKKDEDKPGEEPTGKLGGKSLHVVCTYKNTPLRDLVVTKVDKDDASKVLADAQFELWFDKDGDGAFDKSKDEKIAGPQATGTDGKVRFTKLKARSYFLVETQAPTGYKLLAEPTVVTVAADQDETAVTVENEKILGSVTWSKVDKDNEKPLKGSEWELKDSDDNVKAVTDCVGAGPEACTDLLDKDPAEGSFKVTGLALGSWTLTETKAPFGYKLPAKPDHPFELTEANAEKGIALGNIKNEKQDVPPLPHTGGLGSDAFLIAGGLVLLLALALGGGTYARRYRL